MNHHLLDYSSTGTANVLHASDMLEQAAQMAVFSLNQSSPVCISVVWV